MMGYGAEEQRAYDLGRTQGQKEAAEAVKVLRLVDAMLKDNRAKAELVRDDINRDAPPSTLAQVVAKALAPVA